MTQVEQCFEIVRNYVFTKAQVVVTVMMLVLVLVLVLLVILNYVLH